MFPIRRREGLAIEHTKCDCLLWPKRYEIVDFPTGWKDDFPTIKQSTNEVT